MENIGYPELKSEMCEVFTRFGKPCPFMAKQYVPNAEKMACNRHTEVCRRLYSEYKDICETSLDKRCTQGMSKRELNTIKKHIEECMKHRILFTYDCCSNKTDRGHAYIIHTLNSRLRKCNDILEDRKEERRSKK